eukprot:CAMPEP_0195508992 /NCGR_PEP_ID=MMETSP0794_2-20130614/2054_1 /TAXON_ID=515487 /ORGANISM="Stephanopyxis turris, Strain CCMP 815" /LENGTH=379 /DNA_ID=CAMNT_0040636097 /DNA_START=37 /DNA_END=1176 /DNA_ORIENTATION=-
MLFYLAIFSLIFSDVSAVPAFARKQSNGIAANSRTGSNILSKARALGNDDNEEVDVSWVADYSIVFHSCHTTVQYGRGDEEDGNGMETQNLAHFRLCPSDSCSTTCSGGGDYVVELNEFVDAYTESKMEAQEYACEETRENCNCENDDAMDDEACEKQCYTDAGQEYCIENDDDGDEFDIQEYMDCKEMEINNDDDGVRFFVGMYCSSDSKSVYLGTFSNERCTTKAPSGTYAKYTYGATLPYSSESIVGNDCVSCAVPEEDDDGNGNGNGDDANKEVEIQEICQELYEGAGKCESNLSIDYPSTVACNFIHNVLPQLEKIYRKNTGSSSSSSSSASASTAFAWIFGITTVGLGVFCYTLLQKLKRSDVDLSDQGGVSA